MKGKLVVLLAIAVAVGFTSGPLAARDARAVVTLEVLNPRGEIAPVPISGLVPRVKELDGKKIALIDNGKVGAEYFLDALEELLKNKVANVTVIRLKKPGGTVIETPKFYPIVAQKCDAFVYATGD